MKNLKIICMFCVCLCLTTGEISAYVMPLEQILSRLQKRFATQYSLIIEQATHIIQSRDPLREEVIREKVWIKVPRYERTLELSTTPTAAADLSAPRKNRKNTKDGKVTQEPVDRVFRASNGDAAYRWLLMDNKKGEISAYLSQLGIQIWDLGYDRCDGVVAYRVGSREAESPKLLVDKERFFPLLLSYLLPGDPGGRMVTVRFKDYRKNDAGWYPHEITYDLEGAPTEVYFILNLTANPPIETSFFERSIESNPSTPKPFVNQDQSDDERLKRIMRKLEKKYQ